MFISRTPFRVSFCGGGSDIKAFYEKETGAVVSTSIDRYMYLNIHPFFDEKSFQIKYSKTETVNNLENIQHPIVREALRIMDLKDGGIEISSIADIPSGTGLGSSSAFTVGLLNVLHAFKSEFISKEKLAKLACRIERDILKEPGGKQDQYASAYGGMNLIEFNPDESVNVTPVIMKPNVKNELEKNLLMFYTGHARESRNIQNNQINNLRLKADKFENMQKMVKLTYELNDSLHSNDITLFGELLHKNWILKKQMSSISNDMIDNYYGKAMEAGALGGKLCGAGGGGFLLLYAEPEKHNSIREALKHLKEIDFGFDMSGSQIIFVSD